MNVHINNIKILCYDRIDFSECIDVNKASGLNECIICHYWYFLTLIRLNFLKVVFSGGGSI